MRFFNNKKNQYFCYAKLEFIRKKNIESKIIVLQKPDVFVRRLGAEFNPVCKQAELPSRILEAVSMNVLKIIKNLNMKSNLELPKNIILSAGAESDYYM